MNDFGLLVAQFNTSLPSLTSTEMTELQVDSSGRLIISGRYLEDDAHSSGDAGIFALAVRHDAESGMVSLDGDYAPLQVNAAGRLKVDANISVSSDFVYAEDDAAASGDLGAYVLAVRQDALATSTSLDGDFASFKVDAKGELYVKDSDVKTVLDTIKTDTGNMDTSLNNIETDIDNLARAEDSQHASGDFGIMSLAVRKDTAGSLVSLDGDYAPLQVDANGALRVTGSFNVAITPPGSEEFVVTDALAAGGDGLESITAAATPWITVASFSHLTGTAYLYAYQWACDQNAAMRIITDDTTNITVYKHDINSSAMPGNSESWSESGRIEITGAALLEIKMQIKKRAAPGGNANGSGSMHIRK